jgi:UDP:flavonoid glycosyltransferase YjiC (YdhE family)
MKMQKAHHALVAAPTSSYPQAFAPVLEAGGAYNVLSYSIFDKILWQASSGQINRWRKKLLRVKPTTFERMQQRRIPFIYNFSRAVVPAPLDWSSLIHISGYWFLDQPDTSWKPQEELLEFIRKAKYDGVPIVYAGFGSITIKNVESVIEHIYEAALAADVRVILSKGWSAREKDGSDRKIQLKDPPPNVYLVDSIPHVCVLNSPIDALLTDYLGILTGLAFPTNRCCHAPWRRWNYRSKSASGSAYHYQAILWGSIFLVSSSTAARGRN